MYLKVTSNVSIRDQANSLTPTGRRYILTHIVIVFLLSILEEGLEGLIGAEYFVAVRVRTVRTGGRVLEQHTTRPAERALLKTGRRLLGRRHGSGQVRSGQVKSGQIRSAQGEHWQGGSWRERVVSRRVRSRRVRLGGARSG